MKVMRVSSIAFRILQIAFIFVPILMGLDKFFHILEMNWVHYLSPTAKEILKNYSEPFMQAVGIFEILLGIGILFYSRVFAFILSFWLLLIVINLLMAGIYDDAVRDGGLCLSCFALGILSLKSKVKK